MKTNPKANRYRLLSVLVLAMLVLGVSAGQPGVVSATSTVFRVAPDGKDALSCGSEDQPCRTIQYAVNRAESGDTILVAGGVYTFAPEHDVCTGRINGTSAVVCFFDKQLTVLGGYSADNWSQADPAKYETLIDGQGTRRGVRLQRSYATAPAASLALQGFTIRNCFAEGKTSGSIDDVNVFGAGLLSEHASVALHDVVFRNNEARGGTTASYGGAGAGGAMAVNTTWDGITVDLSGVEFEGNRAVGGDGQQRGGFAVGGALFTYGAVVEGRDLRFVDNQARAGSSGSGSGVYGGEKADAHGAAAAFHGNSNVTLTQVVATHNAAFGGDAPAGEGGGAFGGGLFAEESTLSVTEAEIRSNLVEGGVGKNESMTASQAWGGGVATLNSQLLLSQSHIVENTAQGGAGEVYGGAVSGGGVAAVAVTSARRQIDIVNTVVADNKADVGSGALVGGGGGGVWLLGVQANLVHATIAQNQVGQNLLGQGIILVSWSLPTTADLRYSIVSDHTGLHNVAAVHAQSGTSVNLHRTLYANNTVDDNYGKNLAGAPGSFIGLSTVIRTDAPPNYVSPGFPDHDYHLRADSIARDAATDSVMPIDIDGEPRGGITGVPDNGADEYLVPLSLSVVPVDKTTLTANWQVDISRMTVRPDHYHLWVECESGAASPKEIRCGSYGDLALGTSSMTLTNLTPYKRYAISLQLVDANDELIESSDSVTGLATDRILFVPLIQR